MENSSSTLNQPENQGSTLVKPNISKGLNKALIGQILLIVLSVTLAGATGVMAWQMQEIIKENKELKDKVTDLTGRIEGGNSNKTNAETSTGTDTNTNGVNEPTNNNHQATSDKTPSLYIPDAKLTEHVKAVLDTMDTHPIEGYMAEKPLVIYANDGEVFNLYTSSPFDAVRTLEYLSDARKPWSFANSNEEMAKYEKFGFDKKYLGKNCLIGHSYNGQHFVSLCFNLEKKIETIVMSRTADKL